MVPPIYIGNITGAIYQPQGSKKVNPDGSGEAALVYKCTAISGAAIVPTYLSPHPTEPDLLAFESSLNEEAGGIVTITTIYKGVLDENRQGRAQIDGGTVTAEAPIETHPLFAYPINNPPVKPQELSAIELALQNCAKLPDVVAANPKALMLWQKKRRGIDSYLRIMTTWKRTYASKTLPSASLLANVTKVVTPPAPCPAAPAGQSWLLVGVPYTKQAGVVLITEDYMLSGQYNWDPDLYPQGTAIEA